MEKEFGKKIQSLGHELKRYQNSSNHEILVGHSKKDTILMTTERNDQWPIQNGKEIMGKLDTWMEPKLVDDLFKKRDNNHS